MEPTAPAILSETSFEAPLNIQLLTNRLCFAFCGELHGNTRSRRFQLRTHRVFCRSVHLKTLNFNTDDCYSPLGRTIRNRGGDMIRKSASGSQQIIQLVGTDKRANLRKDG